MPFDQKEILRAVLLKTDFMLDVETKKLVEFTENTVFKARGSFKQATVCLDYSLNESTVAKLKGLEGIFICLEQALDSTAKWNLLTEFGERLFAF